MTSGTVTFFDRQFARQVEAGDFALNPFETLALPYLKGRVLDLGCGLGNLALEAARRGATVQALDASPTAVAHVRDAARRESLSLTAEEADFDVWTPAGDYDAVAAIGLFMFFPRPRALALLAAARGCVAPGGVAVVNVLPAGATWTDCFQPGHYHLFDPAELDSAFAGWTVECRREEDFPAPGGTVKRFLSLVERRP